MDKNEVESEEEDNEVEGATEEYDEADDADSESSDDEWDIIH